MVMVVVRRSDGGDGRYGRYGLNVQMHCWLGLALRLRELMQLSLLLLL